jgi:hypothetical protein
VVAVAALMAQLLPTPEVLVVVHSVHSALQGALLPRRQCQQVPLHLETGEETLLAGGTSTVLVAAAQVPLVAIDLTRVTCRLQVVQV